jgi:hypothetical protein
LNEQTKLKIAGDSTQIEYTFSQFLQSQSLDLSLLAEYTPFREFRGLLFQSTQEITDLKLDAILVCHHLICRTEAIRLPYQVNNWTKTQYCDWIDTHDSQQVVRLLTKCLDEYAAAVVARGESLYCEEYPVLRNLLALQQ